MREQLRVDGEGGKVKRTEKRITTMISREK